MAKVLTGALAARQQEKPAKHPEAQVAQAAHLARVPPEAQGPSGQNVLIQQ